VEVEGNLRSREVKPVSSYTTQMGPISDSQVSSSTYQHIFRAVSTTKRTISMGESLAPPPITSFRPKHFRFFLDRHCGSDFYYHVPYASLLCSIRMEVVSILDTNLQQPSLPRIERCREDTMRWHSEHRDELSGMVGSPSFARESSGHGSHRDRLK
jgi:hypothetical protein